MEIYGWTGKILRIDLTRGKIAYERSSDYVNHFIGGRGVGQWILFNEVEPNVEPLDASNIIVFGTGPLTATLAPASSRLTLDHKNVLTGGTSSSNCGGHFAAELKFAGFDFIVIKGIANRPVYIWIDDNRVEINDASDLWGLNTWETEDTIRQYLNDKRIRVACIGPAGENLVKAACVIVDKARALGRGGSGAVMGSKRLKAVAVRGTGSIKVADTEGFVEEVNKAFSKIDAADVVQRFRNLGTHGGFERTHNMCGAPVRNFQDCYWDLEKVERIKQVIIKDEFETRKLACFNCPIYCSQLLEITCGDYAGLKCEGFKQNLAIDYATKLDIDNPYALIKINALCNQLGLDIDNSSGPIGWAFELYERGILTRNEVDGLELKWGDHETVIELVKRTAYRNGFGNILAEGVKRASEIVGRDSEKYAIHIKGQDLVEGIRSDKGWALGIVVAPRGGGHLDGAPLTAYQKLPAEIGNFVFGIPTAGNPRTYYGKAKLVVWFERFKAIVDMMGVCYFTSVWSDVNLLGPDDYANLFSKATGKNMSGSQLMRVGEQVHNVEKAFNVLHAGFSRKDDYPPKRLMEEPIKSGPFKGETLNKEEWNKMLDEYYDFHGWDRQTSWQTSNCLANLGLSYIAEKLDKEGKLVSRI